MRTYGTGYIPMLILDPSMFISSLKVDPEVLYQKSVTSGEKISQMKTVFEELETIVNKTTQYWLGEAADAHREFFNFAKPDI